jgi:hypothetical protein
LELLGWEAENPQKVVVPDDNDDDDDGDDDGGGGDVFLSQRVNNT